MKLESNAPENAWLTTPPFPFQQTYATPLDDLQHFIETLLDPFEVSRASVWIETLVFNPKELVWYLRGSGIHSNEGELNNSLLLAENRSEAATLLECILGQWADFAFLPTPREFVIYADHDEFTTVFTKSTEKLSSLRKHMKAEGFREVRDWTWTGPRSPRKRESTHS